MTTGSEQAAQRRRVNRRSANGLHSVNRVRSIVNRVRRVRPAVNRMRILRVSDNVHIRGCRFLDDVRAAGLMPQFLTLLRVFQRRGSPESFVARGVHIFREHPALLIQFNNVLPEGYTFLPEGFSCFVPPEEVN